MSAKRKLQSMGLERRVRARREEEWEPESDADQRDSNDEGSEISEEDTRRGGKQDVDSGSDEDSEQDEDDESEEEPTPKVDVSSISFGALARAQASMPPSERKKKRQKQNEEDQEEENPRDLKRTTKKPDASKTKRTSKHAPQEQSSKRPVKRLREVVSEENKFVPRDPRFGPATGGSRPVDEIKARKAYAFLDEYREKELTELRVQAKKTKDPTLKEDLKRQILSMESKKKAQKKKDEANALLAEHRKKEKELVSQGKQPFYLKKSEQKKQLLVNRYAGMSKGQVDRAIERKRKKVAGKEKKELGSLERITSRNNHRHNR